jgi:hypothetical protein
MTSILPCIAVTGGLMQKFVSKYMQSVMIQFGSFNRNWLTAWLFFAVRATLLDFFLLYRFPERRSGTLPQAALLRKR